MNTWVDDLSDALTTNNRIVNERNVLPIVSALRELQVWVLDKRKYHSRHEYAWKSAIKDLEESRLRLGGLTQKLIIRRALNMDSQLAILRLDNQPYMRSAAADNVRRKINKQIKGMLKILGSESAALDAWHDLVSAAQNLSCQLVDLHIKRDIFIDIAAYQEKDLGAFGLSKRITSVLGLKPGNYKGQDDYLKHTYGDDIAQKLIDGQDIGIDEKLELCEKAIIDPGEKADRIVWVEIKRASLHNPTQPLVINNVTLYGAPWIMSHSENLLKQDIPPEVAKDATKFGVHIFSDKQGSVLARVEAGYGLISNAYPDALKLINRLISLGLTDNTRNWRVQESYIVYVGDTERMSSYNRQEEIDALYHANLDPLSEYLESEELRGEALLSPTIDPRVDELLNMRRALEKSMFGSSDECLLASTRIIEHLSGWTDDRVKWYDFANLYLKLSWAKYRALQDLEDQIEPILLMPVMVNGQEHKGLKRIRERVIEHSPTGKGYTFYRNRAITNLRSLSKLDHLLKQRRAFDDIANAFHNGVSLRAYLHDYETQFENTIERLTRYRNSLEHGGPKTELLVESVASFATQIAFIGAGIGLDAMLEHKPLLTVFDKQRTRLDRRNNMLASNSSPIVLLRG